MHSLHASYRLLFIVICFALTLSNADVDPPPSSLGDSSIQSMLDTVMTVQAAHGQLMVNVLTKLQALRADLASVQQSSTPPPFDDEP